MAPSSEFSFYVVILRNSARAVVYYFSSFFIVDSAVSFESGETVEKFSNKSLDS